MSTAAPIFAWQQDHWQRLRAAFERDRLPHALLVSGPAGIGKGSFVDAITHLILCTAAPSNAPCGDCNACRQLAAANHPDDLQTLPEETDKAIGIDAIRALIDRLALTGGGARKSARIEPADALTTAAANSLLKTLEEPPGGGVLILVTDRPGRLPATVRSRCQRIAFGLPPRKQALAWLEAQTGIERPAHWLDRADGAPLAARDLATADAPVEPVRDAVLNAMMNGRIDANALAAGAGLPLTHTVGVVLSVVEDLIRLHHAADARVHWPEQREPLLAVARGVDVRALFAYLARVRRVMPGASSGLRADNQWQGLLADAAAIECRRAS